MERCGHVQVDLYYGQNTILNDQIDYPLKNSN